MWLLRGKGPRALQSLLRRVPPPPQRRNRVPNRNGAHTALRALTRRRLASSITHPPPLRPVHRGLARSPRLLAGGVTALPPLGLPLRRPRAGGRTSRWPHGHRPRERDLTVPRTTYPPSLAGEVLRLPAPLPRSLQSRYRMTGVSSPRQARVFSLTSLTDESLAFSWASSSFPSAFLCLGLLASY